MWRLHWERLSPTENSKTRQKCGGFIGNDYHLQKTVKLPRQKCRGFIGNNYHLQKTVKLSRHVETSLGTTITYRIQ